MIQKTSSILLFVILFTLNTSALNVGDLAPEIVLKDINGSEVTLSSLKGKIVLVDFWASWCHPCREANPFLIDAYFKYHHKGFEILSISLDEDRSHWKKAIEHDKLPWENHVGDLKGWSSKAVQDYGVEALPTSFLINRKGEIVTLDPYAEDLEMELEELLKKEISFYPKNATNKLYFSLPIKYEIRNAKGKKVLKGSGEQVDISTLEKGLFTIKYEGKKESFIKKTNPLEYVKIIERTKKQLFFSKEADYEVHNLKGEKIKSGRALFVAIDSLNYGEYYLHLNTTVEKFIIK